MKKTMSTTMKLSSALLVLASAGAWAWSAASESPSPAPAQPYAVKPVAEPYKILLTRSIFAKDGKAIDMSPRPRGSWGHAPASTQPTTVPAYVAAPPEASYVLKGVAMQDGIYTAFFEQTTENKGIAAHAGETIARGQIVAMSLDGVDYSLKGRATHILIGQDLAGKTVDVGHSTTTSAGSGDWKSRWHHSDTPATTTPAPTTPPAGGPPTATAEQGGNRDFRRSRDGRGDGRSNAGGQPGSDAQVQQPGQSGPDANNVPVDPNAPRRDGPGPAPDPREREADAAPVVVPVVRPVPDDISPEFIDPN